MEPTARKTRGRNKAVGILYGLIRRLEETRVDLLAGVAPTPSTYFDKLNLHSRISDVSRDLFLDGHHWEAVFAAAKALINYIKERSGRHDLDGAPLVRTVFSRNNPLLAFNSLSGQTDQDEQEGMMHLFEGAVLAIRNPGGHSFPEGVRAASRGVHLAFEPIGLSRSGGSQSQVGLTSACSRRRPARS